MDKVIDYIIKNPLIAVCGAAALMFLAGLIFRALKSLAIIFLLAAIFVFVVLFKPAKDGKVKIDDVKDKVKTELKIDEMRKKVKSKVMENL